MLIYRFKPAGRDDRRVALTRNAEGDNLPADGAPWQPIGHFDLSANDPWIKAPRAEIEKALEARGFFLWSIAVPKTPGRFAPAPQG